MSASDSSETFHDTNKLNSLQLVLSKQIEKAHSNFKKSPKDRLTWNYIQTKLKLLDDYWKTYKKNHNKILRSEDSKFVQDDTYLNSYFEVEENYAVARDLMLMKLSEASPPPQQHTESKTNCSSQEVSIASVQQIKLPRIQIPSFDGQYTDWLSFHDHFVSLVHQNKTISNVNKLHLLKQSLKGEAAILLKNIIITENNYEPAWSKLKKRYSNKRVIVNSYFQKLMSMKNIFIENTNALKNLIDTTTDCLSGLNGIGVNTETWDPIIIYLVSSKLDNESLRYWEENISRSCEDNLPTYTMLMDFLETRVRALEGVQSAQGNNTRTTKHIPEKKVFYNMPKEGALSCVLCGEDHYIYKCDKFIEMPVEEKRICIENKNLCYNCLIPYHSVKTCRQKTRCRICGRRHHTLIHTESYKMKTPEKDEQQDTTQGDSNTSRERENNNNVASHYTTESEFTQATQVLLATALVKIEAQNGRTLQLRALIDQGSEGSFITEAATQILGLEKNTINGSISGLGNNIVMRTKHSVAFTLCSRYNTDKLPVNAYVLKSLTRLLPSKQVDRNWEHLHDLVLADPEYWKPAKVDLLLGAEVYSKIMLDGVISGSPSSPLAQRTILGWILSGGVCSTNNSSHKIINMHITTTKEDLDQLQKFWELESEGAFTQSKMTEEEIQCEKIYKETHTRDSEGRYIVEIPFKDKDLDYGDTKSIAEKRLIQLERRLNKDEDLQKEYTKVLMEYLDVGHMEEIDTKRDTAKYKFYMPHHPVIRRDKITSKVRVVFDASCKGPNGKSLNENMLIGPRLQQDLRHIVMRWRLHPIVFIADCIKMYRQIKVTEEGVNYQRILWRVNGALKEYRLLRVTFGTASAPYLATKTLQQLAFDEEKRFPKASQITHTDFYMDDLLSGAERIEDACEVYTQMTDMMKAGGFDLQKWASNSHDFLEYVEGRGTDENYVLKTDDIVKTLGIKWSKNEDVFQYDIKINASFETITKRIILSEISRLFDPLGWLAPVIISAKIIIQKLWLSRVTWDERVPKNIEKEWIQYCEGLSKAKDIKIYRWLYTNEGDRKRELHGYCDASQVAYAAVIFLRVIKSDGSIHVQLITAKSKVAPIKTISVPRLELCGAVLLSRLLRDVATHLNVPQKEIHAYTDSSIVLAWLQDHPSRWKTFVGNRTSEILNTLPANCWSHIDSAQNPADVASRGATPEQLINTSLWWNGPNDLKKHHIDYKQLKENSTDLEKKKDKITVMTVIIEEKEFDLLKTFSSLTRLLRVTAYILRIFKKQKPKEKQLNGVEINEARERCIKLCQRQAYEKEIGRILQGKNVNHDSRIRTLNPFLDTMGVLRVGGRLQNSNLPDYTKHQIILPEYHAFTNLILNDYHIHTLHGGPMLMMSNLRRRYWITHAKSRVKQIVHKCITCTRFRNATKNQMMGSLPDVRVTPSKPFLNCGVDYAGPIDLRLSKGRGCKTQKGYIAVFICMVTRAIHIEVVTSLNTNDFIAAFKRFVARRGHCSDMWSDNATNFSAGNKELKALLEGSFKSWQSEIQNQLANDGTTWHFIPASAPHFGGLWEAGVRSIKFHLKRILRNTTLTYEEMATVTSQIEACLNSRPISPMSDDPSDVLPLTPGHFLLNESPTVVPEESYLDSNINRLTRWQFTQTLLQNFWKRWSKEYLSRLQQRPKWMTRQPNVKIGDLVLLKEDNLPPSKWALGRILAVHPGTDNLVRVITVKCKNSVLKRPIAKVCCLPVD